MNASLYARAIRLLDTLAEWANDLELRASLSGRAGDALAARRVAEWATLIWIVAESLAERESNEAAA
jgi:hypothetical protein